MHKKMIGSILMILGTSIGAGMLALPIVTAHENYLMSLLVLVASWVVMTVGAFSLLEVNLWFPPGSNLISMARGTLGKVGKNITWLIYLLLLYSLICAYLSGMGDITQKLFLMAGVPMPRAIAVLLSLIVLSLFVYHGIASVDRLNRALMSIKLIAYMLLVAVISNQLQVGEVFSGDHQWRNSTMMVMLTSFGFAIIIPSLRTYLDSDERVLKKVVLIGSLIPLLIYALWILVIQGLIPKAGEMGLIHMLSSADTNSLLMQHISDLLHRPLLSHLANLFISICAVTSFLGVSVCLMDFIADGLQVKKQGKSGLLIYGLSFIPPLLIVLVSPGIFIRALNYAGILCLLLLIILPISMLYLGRYKLKLAHKKVVPFGRATILSLFGGSIAMLVINVLCTF